MKKNQIFAAMFCVVAGGANAQEGATAFDCPERTPGVATLYQSAEQAVDCEPLIGLVQPSVPDASSQEETPDIEDLQKRLLEMVGFEVLSPAECAQIFDYLPDGNSSLCFNVH